MPLPIVSGTGFLISDGVDLQYSKNGTAYARLPLVFKKQRKGDDGKWTTEKEVLIQGTVFGKLAEALTDAVPGRTDIRVSGELYMEEHEGKQYLRMNVHSAWPVKDDAGQYVSSGAPAKASGSDAWPF